MDYPISTLNEGKAIEPGRFEQVKYIELEKLKSFSPTTQCHYNC